LAKATNTKQQNNTPISQHFFIFSTPKFRKKKPCQLTGL